MFGKIVRWIGGVTMLAAVAAESGAERLRLAWPTANPAYARGEPLEKFIQPTVSGRVESGLFGCVRTSGWQFHEAIDLLACEHDANGEPTDEVYAVLDGVVRHVNAGPGLSSYGRYVVVEHVDETLPVYTLYAHLASIATEVTPGARVATGQVLGVLGRSAGRSPLPKSRAHVHFEIGLRLTDDFQSWYDWKQFGSDNDHGVWNGMNLTGIDPLAFYDAFRAEEVDTFIDFWRRTPVAVTVRWASEDIPDMVQRYPALRAEPIPLVGLAGWEITFDRFGVPLSWRPLSVEAVADYDRGEVRVVAVDQAATKAVKCKDLVKRSRGRWVPDKDLQRNLQLLLGLRR